MDSLTLMLAGDVMTGRGIDQVLAHPGAPELHESFVHDARDYVHLAERVHGPIGRPLDARRLWGDALAEMQRMQPRWRIVNLETAVTDGGAPWPGKRVHYRMHPANLGCLTAAGLDCCVLANNHVLDWGRAGLLQTLQTLQSAGLQTTGAGADDTAAWTPARLPLAGGRHLWIIGCALASSGVPEDWAAAPQRPGVALLSDLSEANARRLAAIARQHRGATDRMIVSIHWGGNWGPAVPAAHRRFAHRLIDLGAADIVHGHSSHHPMPVEVYRDRLILYGCGDLVNDYEGIGPNGDLRSDVGCLYFPTLDEASGSLQQLQIVPTQLRGFSLHTADPAARRAVEALIAGAEFGCTLARAPGSAWQLRWPGGPPGTA